MNTKRICSALGVGLAFVAVLSLLVAPGFVEARSGNYKVDGGKGDWNWKIWSHVQAYWDDNRVLLPGSSSTSTEANGGTGVTYSYIGSEQTKNTAIIYQSITGKFTPTVGSSWTIKAYAWHSSPNDSFPFDGGWNYV
ncbi:MAG: hypothetical protein FWB84_05795 [Candidatus Bathyarchaeota archaeon]|uniref:hypothetical protein n=1 Tax=Candidatus Bathycorpusculum sp. TaxID=2994959 RepID=UPI00281C8F75|nr:hypothetical protein [Candidatus Termiticorpusculum sp.]MCL2291863.1 hypothetical protein [Candidatus Termiticorpusculum sp.]